MKSSMVYVLLCPDPNSNRKTKIQTNNNKYPFQYVQSSLYVQVFVEIKNMTSKSGTERVSASGLTQHWP